METIYKKAGRLTAKALSLGMVDEFPYGIRLSIEHNTFKVAHCNKCLKFFPTYNAARKYVTQLKDWFKVMENNLDVTLSINAGVVKALYHKEDIGHHAVSAAKRNWRIAQFIEDGIAGTKSYLYLCQAQDGYQLLKMGDRDETDKPRSFR